MRAISSGDVQALANLWAKDGTFTFGPFPDGSFETENGLVSDIEDLGENTKLSFSAVTIEGNTAQGQFSFTTDSLTEAGVGPVTGTFESVIQQGKILSIKATADEATQVTLAAAFAAFAPLTIETSGDVYRAALNSGDLAAFAEILADDFVYTAVPGPEGLEKLTVTGKSAYMVLLADQISNNTQSTALERVVEGDRATGKFSTTADNFRAFGVDVLTCSFETTVRNGKIATLDIVFDDETLQKLGAALAALEALPGREVQAVKDFYQAGTAAWNAGDVDGFLASLTDQGVIAAFDAPREVAKEFLPEFIGLFPVEVVEFHSIEVALDRATVDVSYNTGAFRERALESLVKESGEWKTDGQEGLSPQIPSGVTIVDMRYVDYGFEFDAEDTSSGNFAFKVENAGQESHELILVKLEPGLELEQALQLPPDQLQFVGQGGTLPPGETIDMVFAGPLESGRYGLVCFIPTEDGTPHAFLGMAAEFSVQ